jgi:ribosomal protein L37AE/L43A
MSTTPQKARDYRADPCPVCNTMIVPRRSGDDWQCGACGALVPPPAGDAVDPQATNQLEPSTRV